MASSPFQDHVRYCASFEGHGLAVFAVAVCDSKGWLLSGSMDASVRVWDLASAEELHVLQGHKEGVMTVAASRDGQRAYSGGMDRDILVWDLSEMKALAIPLKGHESTVVSLALSADGATLCSGSDDGSIRVWSTATSTCARTLSGHKLTVGALAMPDSGAMLFSASNDKSARVWDVASGECLQVLSGGHKDSVLSVACSPDGTHLFTGARDKAIIQWDTSTWTPAGRLEGHTAPVFALLVSPDGSTLWSGGGDSTVRAWGTADGAPRLTLAGHGSYVRGLALCGGRLYSASWDKTLRGWAVDHEVSGARPAARQFTAKEYTEGEGFQVKRPIGGSQLSDRDADPFLTLDEMGPVDHAPGTAKGAPWHPHRGFEAVTYVLQGEGRHLDSMGNKGFVGEGGVQHMTAGSGIEHDEGPSEAFSKRGGTFHGFQLWVNLPQASKMCAPRYRDIPPATIPEVPVGGGAVVARVIAGPFEGAVGPLETVAPITYVDFRCAGGSACEVPVGPELNGLVHVYRGEGSFGSPPTPAAAGDFIVLGGGSSLSFSAGSEGGGCGFLLLAGRPLREPVARRGPFVMNSKAEVDLAYDEFHAGTLVKEKAAA